MEILYLLIPISIVFLAVAIFAFFWAIKSRQFNDLENSARLILEEDYSEPQDMVLDNKISKNKTT